MNSFIPFFPELQLLPSAPDWAPPNTQVILNLGLTPPRQIKSEQVSNTNTAAPSHPGSVPPSLSLLFINSSCSQNYKFCNEALTTNSALSVSAPKKFPLSQVLLKPGRDYFQPGPGSLQELGPAHAVLACIPGGCSKGPLCNQGHGSFITNSAHFLPRIFQPSAPPARKIHFQSLVGMSLGCNSGL